MIGESISSRRNRLIGSLQLQAAHEFNWLKLHYYQWQDVWDEMKAKACDTQEINQINTCYPTTSWSETPVRPIDKNGPILPIVCWSDISGGSTQYQSVNGCFSWLPHWTGRRLGGFSGTSAGSNSLSLALIHTWESDDLCLLLLATHTMTFFHFTKRAYFWGVLQIRVVG